MGNFIFTITKSTSNNIPVTFTPSNYDWLTVHSLETGLSIVEVERLWVRFQQLGCDNKGIWTLQFASKSPNKIGKDEFQQNIINQLHSPGQENVTFYDFINAALWLERSTIDDKLKASYAIINGNNPFTVESLKRILIIMFPGRKQENIDRFIGDLFDRIGIENIKTKVKEIGEEDFLFFLKSNIAHDKLEQLFQFKICPDLKPAINERKPPQIDDFILDEHSNNSSIPTDIQLEQLSTLIAERDYTKLSGLLGILQYDLKHLENVHRGNRMKIVYSILIEWKQKEGSRALFKELKRSLYMSGFTDIFKRLEFG